MKILATTLAIAGAFAIALVAGPSLACGDCAAHNGHHEGAKRHHRGNRGHHKGAKGHHGKRGHHFIRALIRAAELTPEQRQQVKAIRASAKAAHKAKRSGFMKQLAAAVASGDDAALEAAFEAKKQAGATRHERKLVHLKKVLAILTDEQRAKVASKILRMQKRRGKHHRGGDHD